MTTQALTIRPAVLEDVPALLEIHNFAVCNLTAAWTEIQDSLQDRETWLKDRQKAGLPVFVAVEGNAGKVIGFGTYGPFRARSGYRLTAEHSIYVCPDGQRSGVGRALLERLITSARGEGYHVLIGAVDGENEKSIAFHRKMGFEISSLLPQIGTKFGRWLDLHFATLVLNDAPAPASSLPEPTASA
ncbi:GNAT family N-acetyltransferase [Roseibium suaedae]|uniref:Phosphinothricin acetyltransferase n=1 Tax=Roseibium suaedae TaxID=735517 RepID=A0A1M6ZVC2_9HYPH|nr:GNAT family N-acetyltransferase [Roseibium suaedae]SHL34346.1 phosphinothricin acetyltransferase [Roseibium suaedae]